MDPYADCQTDLDIDADEHLGAILQAEDPRGQGGPATSKQAAEGT